MTEKETAEKYVREKLDLTRQVSRSKEKDSDDWRIVYVHDLALQHWLRVLEDWKFDDFVDFPLHIDWRANWYPQGNIVVTFPKGHPLINKVINFNLTSGQPSTEEDYRAFNEIIRAEEVKI